jgi:hypothetical protein
MTYASENEVDLVLILGDLFDKLKPDWTEVNKARVILEKTIKKKNWNFMKLGEQLRSINLDKIRDDKEQYLESLMHIVDLEKKNDYLEQENGVLALGINGNHDRTNHEGESAFTMLHHMRYILHLQETRNIFNSDLYVRPMLFKKGKVHIAVYGLNALKDNNLKNKLLKKEIDFEEPPEIRRSTIIEGGFVYRYRNRRFEEEMEFQKNIDLFEFNKKKTRAMSVIFEDKQNSDEIKWITMLLVHQNRHRGEEDKAFYPELLPMDFDFIFWGNEHECHPYLQKPFQSLETRFLFPGSTIKLYPKLHEKREKHICKKYLCLNQ